MSAGSTSSIKLSRLLTGGSRASSICFVDSGEGPICRRGNVSSGSWMDSRVDKAGISLLLSTAELR